MNQLSPKQQEFLDKLFALVREYKPEKITAIGQGTEGQSYVVIVYLNFPPAFE